MSRPRVLLHIGRNKAGSTTIQHACAHGGAVLAAHGIGYGMFGHLWNSTPDLPGWLTFDQLAAHAAGHPDRTWLVSNEFMSAWPADWTREAGRALAGCEVTVIAYLRRYDEWIRSAYAEDTRCGMNGRSIDAYIDYMQPRISAMPNLSDWAGCFGWSRLRIRSTHPDDLIGGDLLTDFSHAIGAASGLPRVADRNRAASWTELELARRITVQGSDEERSESDPSALLALAELMRALDPDPAPVEYLSPEMRAGLQALYRADADVLRSLGQTITAPDEPAPDRPFEPGFERIPADLRNRFFAAARDPAFAEVHPEAAHAARRMTRAR